MVARRARPPAEVTITPAMVSGMLRTQHPDLAHLPLTDRFEGWDNITWRLGDSLAVRMPRRAQGAQLTPTEHVWLPGLAPRLPCRVPLPVRLGKPEGSYPWPWSVVQWVPGDTAYQSRLCDAGAYDLGLTLRALHQVAPADAPVNPYRSTSLLKRLTTMDERLRTLKGRASRSGWHLDTATARRIYLRAVRHARPAPTWAHLDLHGNNVITHGGRLVGIVDWGDAGAGDPATDLGQAMALVGLTTWEALFAGYGFPSPETFGRARAECLYYGVTLACMADEPFASHGWRALRDLGIAVRASAKRASVAT